MKLIDFTIEFSFLFGLLVNAALFVPQIIQLVKTKAAKGFSVITFCGFCLIQIVTMLHGYIRGDYWLVFGYVPSLLTCGTVTILIMVYKKNDR